MNQLTIYTPEKIKAAQSAIGSTPLRILNSAAERVLIENITPELIAECEMVLAASQPATTKEVAVLLHKLSLNYPDRKLSASELQMVAEDWLSDLNGAPHDVIEQAIAKWRRGPQCQFYPKSGQILELVNEIGGYRMGLAKRAANVMKAAQLNAR